MKKLIYLIVLTSTSVFGQTDSLIAYYPFNGNCNETIENNNGSPSSSGISYTTGINNSSNSAIKISGINNGYVNLGNDSSLQFKNNGQYTLSLWVKMATSNSYRAILVKSSNYDHWDYGIMANNGLPYTGKGLQDLYALSKINNGKWHHLVATYNNGHHKLYINGVLEKNFPGGSINESTGNLVLGLKGDALSNQYDGDIDELKIFNKALSAEDITKLSNEKSIITSNASFTKKTFIIYPNPAQNFTTIELNSAEGSLEIFNSAGAVVKKISLTKANTSIDLSSFTTGVYVVKYSNGNSVARKHLVITK
jgi:hypothetical protein